MFEEFFGLKCNPFRINPDPRSLLLTPNTREALGCLVYALHTRRGFVMLTGEVGTGKTTLLNLILAHLCSKQAATAFIFNPRMEALDFIEFMMQDFGVPIKGKTKGQLLFEFNQWLLERHREGQEVVLVIDEAHNLSADLMEEIRLLTNLETSSEKLLQIVLSGQPELVDKLNLPEMRQLKQRITLRCRTFPLNASETTEYIARRIQLAGGNAVQIFSPKSVAAIYHYSRGIPRIVNVLCEHALITSFAEQQKLVIPETVTAVAQELQLDFETPSASSRAETSYVPMSAVNGQREATKKVEPVKARVEGVRCAESTTHCESPKNPVSRTYPRFPRRNQLPLR